MNIIILGSGLLGVTAAYELGRRGHQVTVLDRQPESGRETSFSNGGQISYHSAEPWANPDVLPKLPGWLIRSDAPLVFSPRADWQMVRWGLKFLRNCTRTRARTNCINLLRLGLYSRKKMGELRQDTNIEFDWNDRGMLHIFGNDKDFDQAKRQADLQAKFGGQERLLSRDECLKLEPSLAHTSRPLVGGFHAFLDESGDAYIFCKELARITAERYGAQFHYNVDIRAVHAENNRITGVNTSQGGISADAYVMALGSYSPLFLRPLGLDLPIYPMKGYSITLSANDFCPNLSVTDGTYKIVYTRLGDKLRVAGTAEFAGYDTSINPKRIAPIVRQTKILFPKAVFSDDLQPWACLRPSTPDGPPIMGHTPYANLFLNTGHGTLGWTQAAGSASIVADLMEEKTPEIALHGLTMERYL